MGKGVTLIKKVGERKANANVCLWYTKRPKSETFNHSNGLNSRENDAEEEKQTKGD